MRVTANEKPARIPSVDLLKTELLCKRCGPPVSVCDKSVVGYEEAATVWLLGMARATRLAFRYHMALLACHG
jgi:hypothetical protein